MLRTPVGCGLWLHSRRWPINRAAGVQVCAALNILRMQGKLLLLLYYEAVALVGDGRGVLGKFLSNFNKFNTSASAATVQLLS